MIHHNGYHKLARIHDNLSKARKVPFDFFFIAHVDVIIFACFGKFCIFAVTHIFFHSWSSSTAIFHFSQCFVFIYPSYFIAFNSEVCSNRPPIRVPTKLIPPSIGSISSISSARISIWYPNSFFVRASVHKSWVCLSVIITDISDFVVYTWSGDFACAGVYLSSSSSSSSTFK